MKSLLSTNIYEPRGAVAIVGSCLEAMQPEGYAQIVLKAQEVYSLCLEESHINTAVTKLGAMLSTGQIEKLIFATVDRSPHCTQLHYITHELRRMMPVPIPVEHYVVADNRPQRISEEVIELSKSLGRLSRAHRPTATL